MEGLPQVNKIRIITVLLAFFFLVGVAFFMVRIWGSDSNGDLSLGGVSPQQEKNYEGRIVYIGGAFYPNDEISYVLEDSSGNDVILLKAKDQKLEVSEGLFATVYGRLTKTMDGKKEVLIVERIVVKNAPN